METFIKVVIVDDDQDSIMALGLLLKEYFDDLILLGTANEISDGKELILTQKPDLVFLDIEMPRGTGFDLLESIPERNFEVVFTTGHNDYAIKAIKYSAIDYLLKPVNIDELLKAVNKVRESKKKSLELSVKYLALFENLKTKYPKKLALFTTDSIEYVNVDDVIHIEAQGSYSFVHVVNSSKVTVLKNMKEFQDMLDEKCFFRTHNSHIINLRHVLRFNMKQGGSIEMSDGMLIPIARRKKDVFVDLMTAYINKISEVE